jgi:hypothetical protein
MARQRATQARDAFARVGASQVPAAAPDPGVDDAPAPRVRDVTTSRRRGAAPAVAGSVAFTVRFDPAEALADDQFVLSLRGELGRARLDKAEVVRVLLAAARTRPEVRAALVDGLTAD